MYTEQHVQNTNFKTTHSSQPGTGWCTRSETQRILHFGHIGFLNGTLRELIHRCSSDFWFICTVLSLQRNPEIKLYGLPWVWPGWLGGGKFNPYSNITRTATYITNWIGGAKKVHNLTIDFIGVSRDHPSHI